MINASSDIQSSDYLTYDPFGAAVSIESQIPDYVGLLYASDPGQNRSRLDLFLSAYYEWMESSGNPLYYLKDGQSLRDIQHTFDEFVSHLGSEVAPTLYASIPSTVNKRNFLSHVRNLYRSKGTKQSYRLLFRLLYDELVEVENSKYLTLSESTWRPVYGIRLFPNQDFASSEFSASVGKYFDVFQDDTIVGTGIVSFVETYTGTNRVVTELLLDTKPTGEIPVDGVVRFREPTRQIVTLDANPFGEFFTIVGSTSNAVGKILISSNNTAYVRNTGNSQFIEGETCLFAPFGLPKTTTTLSANIVSVGPDYTRYSSGETEYVEGLILSSLLAGNAQSLELPDSDAISVHEANAVYLYDIQPGVNFFVGDIVTATDTDGKLGQIIVSEVNSGPIEFCSVLPDDVGEEYIPFGSIEVTFTAAVNVSSNVVFDDSAKAYQGGSHIGYFSNFIWNNSNANVILSVICNQTYPHGNITPGVTITGFANANFEATVTKILETNSQGELVRFSGVRLEYDVQGDDPAFEIGQTITGSRSGATAKIVEKEDGILWLSDVSGRFFDENHSDFVTSYERLGDTIADTSAVVAKVTYNKGSGASGYLEARLPNGNISGVVLFSGGLNYDFLPKPYVNRETLSARPRTTLFSFGSSCGSIKKATATKVVQETGPGWGYTANTVFTSPKSVVFDRPIQAYQDSAITGLVLDSRGNDKYYGINTMPDLTFENCSVNTLFSGDFSPSLRPEFGGLISYYGRFSDSQNWISSEYALYDGYKFQQYAYTLKSSKQLKEYANLVQRLIHPAGTAMFGVVKTETTLDSNINYSSEVSIG